MRRILNRIVDLFSSYSDAPGAGRRAAVADLQPIPQKLLKASDTYVFSLASVRSKLGDRWDPFAPSVHRIARRLIFNNLDGKGSFERFGDNYVLRFHRLRGKRARIEGERLYRQFMELLSQGDGRDDPEAARARQASARVSQLNEGGFLRRLARRLRAFFGRAGGDEAVAETSAEQAAEPEIPSAREQAEPREQAPEQRQAGLRQTGGGTAAARHVGAKRFKAVADDAERPEDALNRPQRKDRGLKHLKLLREARSIENAIALAVLRRQGPDFNLANRDFPPPDLSFIYRSMWNLRTRYLTTYTSVPICWKSSMEVHHGESIVPLPRRAEQLFDLDMLCLEDTIAVLGRLTKQKRLVLFMNVVHASTLTNKDTSREFLALVESMPQSACRQLIFEIKDADDYAHHPEAMHMVRLLMPHARAVTACIGLQDRNFAFWKRCGFLAVGADLSMDRRTEEELIAGLGYFAAQAKRCKLLSYLRELDTFSLAIAGAGSGFDFLEGSVVGSSDDPDKLALSRFNIENLYDDSREVVWAE